MGWSTGISVQPSPFLEDAMVHSRYPHALLICQSRLMRFWPAGEVWIHVMILKMLLHSDNNISWMQKAVKKGLERLWTQHCGDWCVKIWDPAHYQTRLVNPPATPALRGRHRKLNGRGPCQHVHRLCMESTENSLSSAESFKYFWMTCQVSFYFMKYFIKIHG